jgi:neurofibromin 1
MACLRTAVKLLENLELKPLDGSIGDDSGHAVSRLYLRYSGILLKGLDFCHPGAPVSSIHI